MWGQIAGAAASVATPAPAGPAISSNANDSSGWVVATGGSKAGGGSADWLLIGGAVAIGALMMVLLKK